LLLKENLFFSKNILTIFLLPHSKTFITSGLVFTNCLANFLQPIDG
jgi:hypothetical protein